MIHLPFSVFNRKGRRFYYVQFKDEKGEYLPAISTKQTSEALAIETAFKWFREGTPISNDGGNLSLLLRDALRKINTTSEADFICKELKRQGFLKTYTITGSKQDIDFPSYLQEFWNFDTSPYVKERLRRNHSIHKNYTTGQKLSAEKYWTPFFKNKLLGDITRQDIENFINDLSFRKLSAGRKNKIIKAGIVPLRWAFSKETIEKDVTSGITWFSGKPAERQILSPEIVQALFKIEWEDERSCLANMLSAITGLRAGEILGLQVQDIGHDCLYIRHSWNCRDGLKTTKNNEDRIVEVPFPGIMRDLLNLAGRNPHGGGMDSYVFWARKSPLIPMKEGLFLTGLRDALVKTGMSPETASGYVFHGWRHFFTTHMRDRLNDKLLKSQTGHKTMPMLNHYSEHRIAGERERIQQAQKNVFGELFSTEQ